MKLSNVLKGHLRDVNIRITNRGQTLEWGGTGILHVASKYKKDWLDKEVINTTKDRSGKTIIVLK